MGFSIPSSVWYSSLLCALFILQFLQVVSLIKQILHANSSMEKKRHIWEGGTFSDRKTESILWQTTQKY